MTSRAPCLAVESVTSRPGFNGQPHVFSIMKTSFPIHPHKNLQAGSQVSCCCKTQPHGVQKKDFADECCGRKGKQGKRRSRKGREAKVIDFFFKENVELIFSFFFLSLFSPNAFIACSWDWGRLDSKMHCVQVNTGCMICP